jgi:6-pyruvoyl-tetrahydropterin synthase
MSALLKRKIVERQKVTEDEIEGPSTEISFKPREEMVNIEKIATGNSSISIPEFLVGEPYPYFYHTWNKLLMCNLNDVSETFHINNSNDLDPNIYVFNNDLKDVNSNCSNFETQHHKYGNSLQNYYTIVNQKTESIDANWKEMERINITSITPVYLQKCENIMTTLLFMPLDQCHDFRGGRTSGSSSWVTEISKGILKKDVDGEQLVEGITENIYSNDFMNTLVKTSFSGKQGIVGIMIIGDESFQLLNNSEYKNGGNLDIQKIMNSFGQFITIGSDITMNCDPRGNRLKLPIQGKDAQIIFLGFTSDGWDKGMHDVWSMNERKHVYSIKIDSIKQLPSGEPEVIYSGDIVTIIENIVPCYEMLYKSKDEGNPNAFINNFENDGKKITKSNFNDFFSQEAFDKLYKDFLAELYRTGKHIDVEEDEEEQGGGAIDETSILRGATYKFYGVRAPDSKTSERLSPENRARYLIFENIFIEILKKISKSISPQIHPDFKYPDVTNVVCDGTEENLNERIQKVNDLYENIKDSLYSEYPKSYNKDAYNLLRTKMNNGCDNSTDDRFIIKQFGTVNDMNIAPVIEKVIDSLNCSDNCDIVNVERVVEDLDENEDEPEERDESSQGSTTAASESSSDTSEVPIAKLKTKKKEFKSPCQSAIETNIEQDLNNKYPFKFQVVSGVLDSSLQGGENMPEYFPPEMDIFMTIFDNQGNLQGAVVRMTFLKVILKNTTNTKNNARVYSHFVYVGFDEINLECEDKLGENWKLNSEQYPFALKQLINYTVNNTSFIPSLSDNLVSNFELELKDNTSKRWYFYFSDTAGPSVSEGINDVVKKIFSGTIGIVSDENVDVSESIVKVAQKLYMDSPKLREIFTQQAGIVRSYAFESIFLLKIKYIGDKSRCTDSLFLNRNKYAECMQITGDENAYFTALVNGASTIYSPPSRFAFYFAPYFTYGDVENEGKFLLNLPLYKETLLKGESPTEFKISSSSSKKKTINTEAAIPFESSLVKERGPIASGVDVRNKANDIIRFVEESVDIAYADAQSKSRKMAEVSQLEDLSKKTSKQKEIKKALDGYVSDYNELEELYKQLKETVDRNFIGEIERNENELTHFYYNKIIEQLRNIFTDNEFIIEPVVISKEDFERIKQEIIEFIEKALQSMKTMSSEPYSKTNPPQMLDINGEPVIDKKGNVLLPGSAYEDLKKNIPVYERILNSLKQIEDVEEFYGVLKELNDLYTKNISTLKGASQKVIFWNSDINTKINFIFSLSDIVNHILPNIKTAKGKFASQTNKYDRFKSTINTILSELPDFSRKKTPASAPLKTAPKLVVEKPRAESAPAVLETTKVEVDTKEDVPEIKIPTTVETPSSSVIKAKATIGRQSLLGGGPNEESYRKNQIYILKCFSNLIKTNNSEYEGLISPDKLNFNYENIKSIDDYCISILMLQAYYSFNSFQPKLKSLQDITDEIATLNEDTSTLQDAINIRNYYSQIIDIFINIEYMQDSSLDYILTALEVDIIEGDTIIYDLKKWSDVSFYLITFILYNLKLISSNQDKFVNNLDDKNYRIMSEIHSLIGHIDIKVMNGYYELSKSKEEIDKLEDFTQEEKNSLLNKISIVESYEYLCLFLIKFCNNFLMKITNNQLKYSKNGLTYDYEIIKNKIGKELADKFDNIKINIGNSNKVEDKVFNFTESGNLKNDLESINNILLELSSVNEVVEIPVKDLGKGIPIKYDLMIKNRRPITPMFNMPKYRMDTAIQAAGTVKNRRTKNNTKTRNNKIKNKKCSIKKRENRIKRNTRRS